MSTYVSNNLRKRGWHQQHSHLTGQYAPQANPSVLYSSMICALFRARLGKWLGGDGNSAALSDIFWRELVCTSHFSQKVARVQSTLISGFYTHLYVLLMLYLFVFYLSQKKTATCVTYAIKWLVFITEIKSVYCVVRTRFK